ncbi:hypothetical protein Clacol_002592 [Clathrus columnatus]|uniref:Rho-GAP domain-containing protein n=1 Tax=Clathrus columnatus TaxID=1419009 RepID=A0AAV5A597_9AGAM|nr:hypothetical protein Clacol_002592 [Clathrus columnatus]
MPHSDRQDSPPPSKASLKAWWKQFTANPRHKKPDGEEQLETLRRVFGVPLRQCLQYASVQISTANSKGELYVWGYIPVVVAKWFASSNGLYLKENATEVSGTFRVNGSAKRMRELQALFEEPPKFGKHLDLKQGLYTTHDVASVFRRYLTSMPVIFARKSDKNLMTAANLAVIFRPGIISHPDHELSPEQHKLSQDVLEFLIAHQDWFMLDMPPPPRDVGQLSPIPRETSESPVIIDRPSEEDLITGQGRERDERRSRRRGRRRATSVSERSSQPSSPMASPPRPSSMERPSLLDSRNNSNSTVTTSRNVSVARSRTMPSRPRIGVPNGEERPRNVLKKRGPRTNGPVIGSLVAVVAIIAAAIVIGVVVSKHHKSSSSSIANNGGATPGVNGNPPVISNPDDPSQFEKDPNLLQSFYGLAYSPQGSQLPECGATLDAVIEDIQLMSQVTKNIRLYGPDCNQTFLVMDAIQRTKVDMTVWAGLYPVPNNLTVFYDQLAELEIAFKTFGTDNIAAVTVGNEFMLNYLTALGLGSQDINSPAADQGADQLLNMFNITRGWLAGLGINKKVCNSDAGSFFNEMVIESADCMMMNVHPYFAGVPANQGAAWVAEYTNSTLQQYFQPLTKPPPEAYIAETGWPSSANDTAHDTDGAAVADMAGLQTFLDTFVCQANANNTKAFFFEAFDEPWKGVAFGGVEANWGSLKLLIFNCLATNAAYILQSNNTNSSHPALPPPSGGDQTNPPSYRAASDFDYQSIILALNQEYIELDLFYYGYSRFSRQDFQNAGLNDDDRYLIKFMGDQELGHARAISNLAGDGNATQPCNYSYPFNDVRGFIDFSQIVTRYGESGTVGFLAKMNSRESSQIINQAINVEARQQMAFRQFEAMPFDFIPSITQSMQWSLLAPYITECPSSNPRIKWNLFPPLNVTNAPSAVNSWLGPGISRNRSSLTSPGREVRLSWRNAGEKIGPRNFNYTTVTNASDAKFAAWISQLNVTYTPLYDINDTMAATRQPNWTTIYPGLPTNVVNGTVFVAVVDQDVFVTPFNLSILDSHILAGPALYMAD